MTEKQENIINAALELFAGEGYNATSTSKVAKAAGVSEGLIFRHFQNKEGLLQAILQRGEERLRILYADIVMEPDPKTVIKKTIELPLKIDDSEYTFWKLQYKLKWEMEVSSEEKMEPLIRVLSNAFKQLGFKQSKMEAYLLIYQMEGLASNVLRGASIDQKKFIQFLKKKYSV